MIRPRISVVGVPKGLRYFVTESLLIVLSILLALAANGWRVNVQEQRAVEASAQALHSEIMASLSALEEVDGYYRAVADAVGGVIGAGEFAEDDEAQQVFSRIEVLRPTLLGLTAPINHAAWDIAKDRGDVSRMPVEVAKPLVALYDGQMPIFKSSAQSALDVLMSSDMYRPAETAVMLRTLQAHFYELSAQRGAIVWRLQAAQEALNAEYPNLTEENR
ncbi:hypothetical protein [Parvularcula sp. LCG005]|uniref:hypothetical protein n=1 Tax=Parvularcula sp. LCG005 TaxID=3078805 RepID=UPI00294240B5|nr:hypothetical protein [Parvularcula sp. LCG005]WOI53844.1 hypothetical protein RUI03_02310 [Parvularcula sp. LCG005]